MRAVLELGISQVRFQKTKTILLVSVTEQRAQLMVISQVYVSKQANSHEGLRTERDFMNRE